MDATNDRFKTLPKVSLHDHLDGGLRPESLPELAALTGYQLPAEPGRLADWFTQAANSGDLATYLTTFDHTIACMQTAEQLRRVAREWVEDQHADGVVLAEARWAPEQHTQGDLSMDEAVVAVADGLREGMESTGVVVGQIVTAMRHADRSLEVADVALRHLDDLVVGFDIAGGEKGNPPSKHRDAFKRVFDAGLPITIHAGEDEGPSYIAEALECGARRIGHGIRILDDFTDGRPGMIASEVLDKQIVLEVCPSSNAQTGAAESLATHPVKRLMELGFRVTLNPDNRLMSATTLTREFELVDQLFGLSDEEINILTRNGFEATFLPDSAKQQAAEKLNQWQQEVSSAK